MPTTRALVIPAAHAGKRLDQSLAELMPEYSRSRIQGWIDAGLVGLGDAPANRKQKVWGGEAVTVTPAPLPEETAFRAEAIALPIVHEDADILVIDKPAGLVTHPGAGNWEGTLLNALLHHVPGAAGLPRAGIVHRLDKDTSGLMVVAKTLPAQTELVRQLQARSVKRHYLALVHGKVGTGGTVDAPLGRHPVQRTKMAVLRQGGREARTHYEVRERFNRCTLVECRLETGRTHQIRVHMASIHHPLVGDPVYGKTKGYVGGDPWLDAFPRQALHAFRLALVHPATGAEMAWESPLPADFAALLEALREA